jgi:hypothetical protein
MSLKRDEETIRTALVDAFDLGDYPDASQPRNIERSGAVMADIIGRSLALHIHDAGMILGRLFG